MKCQTFPRATQVAALNSAWQHARWNYGERETEHERNSNGICWGWLFSLHVSNSKMLSDEVIYDVLRHLCVCKHSVPTAFTLALVRFLPLSLSPGYINLVDFDKVEGREGDKKQTTQIGTH